MKPYHPIRELERKEPFTTRELKTISRQKRAFIRGIQLRDKSSKKEAMKESNRYFLLPNKKRKEFSKSIQSAIEKAYPFKQKKRDEGTGEIREIKQKERKLPIREHKFSNKYTRIEVFAKLENKQYSPAMTKRMNSAIIKFPHDSLYQWQRGHNAGKR